MLIFITVFFQDIIQFVLAMKGNTLTVDIMCWREIIDGWVVLFLYYMMMITSVKASFVRAKKSIAKHFLTSA